MGNIPVYFDEFLPLIKVALILFIHGKISQSLYPQASSVIIISVSFTCDPVMEEILAAGEGDFFELV